MELYAFQNVSFFYPEQRIPALRDLSFSVSRGEFLILCGPSGCGKSTLLRHLKTCLTPHGVSSGEIRFRGLPLAESPEREQAQKIGFVLQSPENQVVTDKVWHELAFGLESLGMDTPTIRRRVAEIAAFFGIEQWFYKNVAELSGGQKQLLSLASVMAMQPDVLVLDEPTAQLDPIAATEFLALLGRINREMGTTVILSEHRLEEAFPFATRVIAMEDGAILCDGAPEAVGLQLKARGSEMFLAMPAAMRVWAAVDTALPCPVTVRDGVQFLCDRAEEKPLLPLSEETIPAYPGGAALCCQDLWFRYEKDAPDVVKGFSLRLQTGEFYALLGGNGAGKTTVLKVLAGLRSAYRGEVTTEKTIGLLPQNPQTLFVKRTVREDLLEIFRGTSLSKEAQERRVAQTVALCDLKELLDRHPYDLSGGEQQRAALAKVLLTAPDILLLDEPTKGFDAYFKEVFAQILKKLLRQGVTVLMVSHDVAFCAEHAHRCGLFFDGAVVAEGTPRAFFSGNSFYTTPANRMARDRIPRAVTANDVIQCCGGQAAEAAELPEATEPLAKPAPEAAGYQPAPLPLWRKLLAALSAGAAAAVFLSVTGVSDLSALIGKDGVSHAGWAQLKSCFALIAALLGFIAAVGRRSAPPVFLQTPRDRRRLEKRTLVAAVLILLAIPLTVFAGVVYLGGRHYNLIALLVLAECMLPFALVYEGRKPKARELVTVAALCAIGVAGKSLLFMLPQFKPVMALTIIAGVAFGGETGFLVGAMTMLASNMLFSQGPWTPWQMFAMGIIGFLAGVLFRKGWLRRSREALAVFGAFSAVVIYGGIMNPASAVMWSSQSLSWEVLMAYYVSGLPMDLVHAFATAIFLLLAAEPMLEKLDRIKVKYGMID